ncbi:hypothetical protein JCGZ_23692 [Jatropha curcas]|uniref:Uncharacterized protein n=1 Tax=Jatropha curcas TaxID=180498 RepID=A0A067L2Y5_JATCU|nr:hypothetical protein JCGZ_23692 [Jatropha curcas]
MVLVYGCRVEGGVDRGRGVNRDVNRRGSRGVSRGRGGVRSVSRGMGRVAIVDRDKGGAEVDARRGRSVSNMSRTACRREESEVPHGTMSIRAKTPAEKGKRPMHSYKLRKKSSHSTLVVDDNGLDGTDSEDEVFQCFESSSDEDDIPDPPRADDNRGVDESVAAMWKWRMKIQKMV